jgi:hypothetical protein
VLSERGNRLDGLRRFQRNIYKYKLGQLIHAFSIPRMQLFHQQAE